MTDEDIIARVNAIAAGLDEPARADEVRQHYEAVINALNGSTNPEGDQDGLCVFEALALVLGQLTADMALQDARGFLRFVQVRSVQHRDTFAAAGKGARLIVEPDHV